MARRMRWGAVVATAAVLGLSLPARRAGAQTIDPLDVGRPQGIGARAMGMGGAFAAVSDDATAISWNPAGPGDLAKPELSVGYDPSTRIEWLHPQRSDASYRYAASTETATSRLFDHATFAAPVKLGSLTLVPEVGYWRALDLGLDRDTSYSYGGLEAADFPNRYRYTSSEKGGLDVWSAGAALRIRRGLSLGIALDYWQGKARAAWTEDDDAVQSVTIYSGTFEQTYSGVGARAAFLVSPSDKLRFAAVVRVPTKLNLEHAMDARFEAQIHAIDQVLDKDGKVDWPLAALAGVAFRPVSGLTVAADAAFTQWSKAIWANHYLFTTTTTRQGAPTQRSAQEGDRRQLWPTLQDPDHVDAKARQSDSLQARLGAEYVFRARDGLSFPVRAGGFLDRALVRDDSGDQLPCLGITAGLGVTLPHVSLSVAWIHESGQSAVQDAASNLKRTAQRFYISATVKR